MPHRLPCRRRLRPPPAAAGDATGGEGDATAGAAEGDPSSGAAAGAGPDPVPVGLLRELVHHSNLSTHIPALYATVFNRIGWRENRHIRLEVELGSTLTVVEGHHHEDRVALDPGPSHPHQPAPLLLRAFRRGVAAAAAAVVENPHNCCAEGGPVLADWAPPCVAHLTRTLLAPGAAPATVVHHGATRSTAVHLFAAGQQRTYVTRRCPVAIGINPCEPPRVEWKVKYGVPVSYNALGGDVVHFAWEADADADAHADADADWSPDGLVRAANRLGILPTAPLVPPESVTRINHVRVRWPVLPTAVSWDTFLQLQFAVVDADPQQFRRRVLRTTRPRCPADVPRWLVAVGLEPGTVAQWRIEVELHPPYHPDALVRALRFHQLLRLTAAHLPTARAAALFAADCAAATTADAVAADFARTQVAALCGRLGIPVAVATGYPCQPRPRDFVRRDLATPHLLAECAVTPKVDGLEAFLCAHAHGCAVLFRSGLVRSYPWPVLPAASTAWRPYPVLLEGEWIDHPPCFVAYDCVLTPVAAYARRGRHVTRQAALHRIVRRLRVCGFRWIQCKPAAEVARDPHAAIVAAVQWAADRRIPCDGVVLANVAAAYVHTNRLWKLKRVPTVDFALRRVGTVDTAVYELMLRNTSQGVDAGALQSLHRFRYNGRLYVCPVLLRAPPGLLAPGVDSERCVVEVGVQVDDRSPRVRYTTVQAREPGKQPNCLVAGMDVAANGLCLDALLRADDPAPLLRVLLAGPLRTSRVQFARSVMHHARPTGVLEVGGGRGGDCHLWATAPGVRCIDVVDPDESALAEYARRLVAVYHAIRQPPPDGVDDPAPVTLTLPSDGRRFRLHCSTLFDLPETVGCGAGLAALHFCASQIVGEAADADRVVQGLIRDRAIPWVAVVMHDHVFAGVDGDDHGVTCRVEVPSTCPVHPLACTDPGAEPCRDAAGRPALFARLRTCVAGSSTAVDIGEWAIGAGVWSSAARRARAAGCGDIVCHLRRPFSDTPGVHWLLRSLTMVVLHRRT